MTEQCERSVTDRLIETTLNLSFDTLPGHVVDRTKELVLDLLGATIYGATQAWSQMTRAMAEDELCTPVSSIILGAKTSARNAALANGTAAHAIELDDTHDESLSHPGAVVIPAALAVAEMIGSSGKDFLAAVIAGYEAQCRIGAAVSSRLVAKGFHPTAQVGVYGAAAASSRLMGHTHQQATWAFGLAGSMASGIMKFTQDPEGTMVKRLHAGMAAEHGVTAALLASKNFTGPRDILERDYGYARTFVDLDDLSRITDGLGEEFEIGQISVKLYPCCRMFHSLIEAIATCKNTPGFSVERIERIEALGPSNMIKGHLERRPRSSMSAQFSLPYTAAIAVLSDPSQPSSFEEPMMSRSDVLMIADKVTGHIDPELHSLYPRKNPALVRFFMKNGLVIEEKVLDSKSTPANPIPRRDIESKFESLTQGAIDPASQARIKSMVFSLESADNLSTLSGLLRARDPKLN